MIGGIDLLDRDGEGADGGRTAKLSSLSRIDSTTQQVEGLKIVKKITFSFKQKIITYDILGLNQRYDRHRHRHR